MSASLVGSEMCIRDSPLGGAPQARVRSFQLRDLDLQAQARHCSRRHRISVSYTHLTLPTICSV
eukprot:12955757-Alexandrium_andersonii.AAC.1